MLCSQIIHTYVHTSINDSPVSLFLFFGPTPSRKEAQPHNCIFHDGSLYVPGDCLLKGDAREPESNMTPSPTCDVMM